MNVKKADDEEEESDKLLPDMNAGDDLKLLKVNKEQKFTKPPVRFTDATLVKAIEENGIGRPSTYATIIGTLTKRQVYHKERKISRSHSHCVRRDGLTDEVLFGHNGYKIHR